MLEECRIGEVKRMKSRGSKNWEDWVGDKFQILIVEGGIAPQQFAFNTD